MPFPATVADLHQLAVEHHQAGRLAEAEALYRQVLGWVPGHADALHLLGVLALQTGHAAESVALIRQAVQLVPGQATYRLNLGNSLLALKQRAAAIAEYRAALALAPHFEPAWSNLGSALHAEGLLDESIAAYREALKLNPDSVDALTSISVPLCEQGRFTEAAEAARRALALRPDSADASLNLGNALVGADAPEEAVAAFRRALELRPDLYFAYSNQCRPLELLGRMAEGEECCRRALALQPGLVVAQVNLGHLLHVQGRTDEALEALRRARELDPTSPAVHSSYLAVLQYSPRVDAAGLRAAHEEYERAHGVPRRAFWAPHRNTRDPERRLKLGFISPSFATHPVGWFFIRVLQALSREHFHVTCYADGKRIDEMTARLRQASDVWRETADLSETELTAAVRADEIDILFDLAGHTSPNRLPVFARKPAPVQVTWLDYVGTTGLAAMDYLLADARQVPPGAEGFYCEQVLRMPDDYICFDPPAVAPEPGPLPALEKGFVTFGNLGPTFKLTAEILRVWAEILERVPHSRLVLKHRGYQEPRTQATIRAAFTGLAAERLVFRGWSPLAHSIATYREIDLALDTTTYNGGLTSCEALWMGVPVITQPGDRFASRHGLAHLTAAGFTESIAADAREYVELAVAWASDLPRLAQTRATLRERVAASPLVDGPRFAAAFEKHLREIWRRWVAS